VQRQITQFARVRTLPTAFAAPVLAGMMLALALRPPRQSFLLGPSTVFCVAVVAWTVCASCIAPSCLDALRVRIAQHSGAPTQRAGLTVMSALTMPKFSWMTCGSSQRESTLCTLPMRTGHAMEQSGTHGPPPAPTLASGARQLVVQEAFETTSMLAPSYLSSLTPITNIGASLLGAEMTTCRVRQARTAHKLRGCSSQACPWFRDIASMPTVARGSSRLLSTSLEVQSCLVLVCVHACRLADVFCTRLPAQRLPRVYAIGLDGWAPNQPGWGSGV